MFGWLTNLFRKNTDDDETFGLYHPKETLIYTYWNGQKLIKADPLTLYKKMMEQGPDLQTVIKVASSIHKDASKAHTEAVSRIRSIFNVKSYEEGGLTEIQTMDLLDNFLTFSGFSKKNSNPSPISSGETSGPSDPSPVGNPHTPNSGDSGSAAAVPPTDSPIASKSESPLPSGL